MTAAVARDQVDRPRCWCCGDEVDEAKLTRLGNHPEVGVCARCARWLARRARAAEDRGRATPGARARRALATVRVAVMRRGIQRWPVLRPLLRRLDRHLP
ncbi:hypothetical protein [Nostocoides sp. HKS02]|uniref:hypothetical protein n=1 Tax=Nostocoides sp. HKS02 TaxID=1813880 RepID=UPI0012B4A57B|nr:hypothetical protein [Tetrasphaera sp. HKS02]QGN58395.1 hypothetical protein GKE56_11440 [Tetrasphaera sp. HKS02]